MPSDYQALSDEVNQQLIDFLLGEIQMGVTWTDTAVIAKDAGEKDHNIDAQERAEKVAKTVRRLMDLVQDGHARPEIAKRLAELDRLISTL
jgi:hypothetical protein